MTKHQGPYCGGKLLKRDGTCTLSAGWGTEHPGFGRCRKHLGNTPTVIRAAVRERLDAEASRLLADLDAPPCTEPLPELQRVVGQAVAWKDFCAANLNTLRAVDLRYESAMAIEQVRAEVLMWERALDRAIMALEKLTKLHISEEIVVLKSRIADLIIAAFEQAIRGRPEVPPEIASVIRSDFGKRLAIAARVEPAGASGPDLTLDRTLRPGI